MPTYTDTISGVREAAMTLSRRQVMIGGAALGLALPFAPALAEDGSWATGDMTMGAEDAPIEVIEYASMTCPHCASFHHATWPKLKENWIDTGKVRFVFREFPFDRPGLAAAMLARCGGEQRFFAFIDILFKQQEKWTRAQDPMAELRRIATLGGVSPEAFDRCLASEELQDMILESRLTGHEKFGVQGTPTLIINGEKHEGGNDYESVAEALRGLSS